jgi:hypothetical protein
MYPLRRGSMVVHLARSDVHIWADTSEERDRIVTERTAPGERDPRYGLHVVPRGDRGIQAW